MDKTLAMKFITIVQIFKDFARGLQLMYFSSRRDRYGYIHPTATVLLPGVMNKRNVYLYEHTNIGENFNIISNSGKFIMKKNSISGPGLTVICQNHDLFNVGSYPGDNNWSSGELASDVIVEDGVWIGANVTLCPGAHIERGCIVAAGSVCPGKKIYPPYTIIGGNPAHVLKYRFTLDQQREHEKLMYNEEDRLDNNLLSSYYEHFNKNVDFN